MNIDTDFIISFMKMFIINMCVYYCFEKITNNNENRVRNNLILVLINFILLSIYVPIKREFNSFLIFVVLYLVYTVIISKMTNNKIGYSMIITIISYATVVICQSVGTIIQFVPYKLLYKLLNVESKYLSLVIIMTIQILLLYGFFKIKRFRNGFSFLKNKLDNEIIDTIVINVSVLVVLIYCLIGTYYDQIRLSLAITFFIICIAMYFTIRKMITMYYKQKLLMDTMEQYKQDIAIMQDEMDELKRDKQNISKITHEFYNRQKALELLVGSNMNPENVNKENVSENVLSMIETLTNEYSERFEKLKELPKLEKTEIPEIDNMFTYMQSECVKNNIEFKLKIIGNIHSLVNNIISKSKLETLIGDHLRDAINAVNLSEVENKEIFAVLGIKNKKYELSIFDTGIDFEIPTLLKLGLEAVTTNKERGGTGTGFMTTFETMKETNASLIITEYPKKRERFYTKCVTIRFDGNKQYKICSYRSKEIKKMAVDNRIKIEKNTNND